MHRHACAHGIAFHVTHRGPKMVAIERAGKKSALPEVPVEPVPLVKGEGIARMRVAECAAQRVLVARNDDKVNVVGHQAIGPYLKLLLREIVGHRLSIGKTIRVVYENITASIPALRCMMRQSRNHHSRQPAHACPIYPPSVTLQ